MKRKTLMGMLAGSLLIAPLAGALGATEARENWMEHCVKCHGEDGRGKTKSGKKLRIKDLTTPRMQERMGGDQAEEVIAEGSIDNDGNERMPAFRDKLTEQERAALVEYIKTLADTGE